jgi:hypothetical protein
MLLIQSSFETSFAVEVEVEAISSKSPNETVDFIKCIFSPADAKGEAAGTRPKMKQRSNEAGVRLVYCYYPS